MSLPYSYSMKYHHNEPKYHKHNAHRSSDPVDRCAVQGVPNAQSSDGKAGIWEDECIPGEVECHFVYRPLGLVSIVILEYGLEMCIVMEVA
jgi:hypothetical protein